MQRQFLRVDVVTLCQLCAESSRGLKLNGGNALNFTAVVADKMGVNVLGAAQFKAPTAIFCPHPPCKMFFHQSVQGPVDSDDVGFTRKLGDEFLDTHRR